MIKNLAKFAKTAQFVAKRNAPEICTLVGIGLGIGAGVLACKATIKAKDILEESKLDVDAVHQVMEDPEFDETKYSEEDSKRDLAVIYARTGVELAKTYAPAMIFTCASIACIVTGNKILRKRNVALAAAYTVVDKAFKDYRSNVVERFGADVDRELRYNLVAETVTETITDEKGKEKKVKRVVHKPAKDGVMSGYARVFDAANPGWENNAPLNLAYLRAQQSYCQKKLETDGYLFLNDVYKLLGYREDVASRNVGWIYDESNPIGDNFIDFGFENDPNFVAGYSTDVILDFNVDGPIMERFEKAYRGWAIC